MVRKNEKEIQKIEPDVANRIKLLSPIVTLSKAQLEERNLGKKHHIPELFTHSFCMGCIGISVHLRKENLKNYYLFDRTQFTTTMFFILIKQSL